MYFQELTIPADANVEVSGNHVKVSTSKDQQERNFDLPNEIKIEKIENKIKVSSESERRKIKALIGTTLGHIRNMIDGLTKGFTYKLKIIYSHFPITVKIEKDKVLIQNFLGERNPRIAKILGKTQVKVEGQDVIATGNNLADVSQTAANIEQATRIVGVDKKVFQDGIFITSKGE